MITIPQPIDVAETLHYRENSTHAAAEAEKRGFTVEFPDEYTLQLDIDDEASSALLGRMYGLFEQLVRNDPAGQIPVVTETTSKSGHRHVRIRLPFPVTPLERIALQACLGSDVKRELLSIFDFRAGDLTPTMFFEVAGATPLPVAPVAPPTPAAADIETEDVIF